MSSQMWYLSKTEKAIFPKHITLNTLISEAVYIHSQLRQCFFLGLFYYTCIALGELFIVLKYLGLRY